MIGAYSVTNMGQCCFLEQQIWPACSSRADPVCPSRLGPGSFPNAALDPCPDSREDFTPHFVSLELARSLHVVCRCSAGLRPVFIACCLHRASQGAGACSYCKGPTSCRAQERECAAEAHE